MPRHPSKKSHTQKGQATLEYIFVLSFSVVTAVFMARFLMGKLDNKVLQLGGTIEKQLKTGRAPVSIWKN